MSMMKAYAAALKAKGEAVPEKRPYCQIALLELRDTIMLENIRQSAVKYNLIDVVSFVPGKEWTFSLTYEKTLYPGKSREIIKPGTPVTEGNIDYAAKMLLNAVQGTELGRWNEESQKQSMDRIRRLIEELESRKEAQQHG